jgi:tartrate dehydrogenase/decarboxylase / D-malate dehydrogenase
MNGIEKALEYKEKLTVDLGGKGTTAEVGYLICGIIEKALILDSLYL